MIPSKIPEKYTKRKVAGDSMIEGIMVMFIISAIVTGCIQLIIPDKYYDKQWCAWPGASSSSRCR